MSKKIIHIGFPKTGSTLLQTFFDSHPSIHHNRQRFQNYTSTGKITTELVEELIGAEKIDVLSEELLSIWSGDTSNVKYQTYNMKYDIESHQQKTAEDLKALFPCAKVLIVTRGYQSLMLSLYSQYLLTGGTKRREVFREENEELILKLYNYNSVIDLYRSVFSNDQVIVLPFELLKENTKDFLIQLENIIEVDHFDFDLKIVHASIPKNLIFWIRITTWVYTKYLSVFHKKEAQQKFMKYLEKLYRFKDGSFAKLFNGKNKKVKLSDSFVEEFSLNSSTLDHIALFNLYISKYRK